MPKTKEMNKKNLSVLDSFKIIFSRNPLGEEAAIEHIVNNSDDSSSESKKKA